MSEKHSQKETNPILASQQIFIDSLDELAATRNIQTVLNRIDKQNSLMQAGNLDDNRENNEKCLKTVQCKDGKLNIYLIEGSVVGLPDNIRYLDEYRKRIQEEKKQFSEIETREQEVQLGVFEALSEEEPLNPFETDSEAKLRNIHRAQQNFIKALEEKSASFYMKDVQFLIESQNKKVGVELDATQNIGNIITQLECFDGFLNVFLIKGFIDAAPGEKRNPNPYQNQTIPNFNAAINQNEEENLTNQKIFALIERENELTVLEAIREIDEFNNSIEEKKEEENQNGLMYVETLHCSNGEIDLLTSGETIFANPKDKKWMEILFNEYQEKQKKGA